MKKKYTTHQPSNYIKKRNGVDLTNVPSDKSWTELNPLRDIEQLPSNVVEFLNQKHNKENLTQFLAHFSIAFSELETKVTQVDEKTQANFEILEDIREVREIIPLIRQIHQWTFTIANLLNAELNYPAPKSGEFLEDPEDDD